jgi:hypothetical protein
MQSRAGRADREPVDVRRLVAGLLRVAPDVAIVGEVRDREGLPEIRAHPAARGPIEATRPVWHRDRRSVRPVAHADPSIGADRVVHAQPHDRATCTVADAWVSCP